jgi:ribosomal subunit interface protein
MKIQVRSRGIELTPELRERVERRLRFAFGRFQSRIEGVRVSLEDVNGPRGGVDKHCGIVVVLPADGEVVLDESDADVDAAVARLADRAARAVARSIERKRERRR